MLARAKPVPVAAWSAVAALAAAGLVLRLLAADGALWTDEAWSALHAAEVQTPLGVFLFINHDNNHHLYSLWLQAIGLQASPLLARAPAIIAGTLAILVAAMIGARRSAAAAIVAAAWSADQASSVHSAPSAASRRRTRPAAAKATTADHAATGTGLARASMGRD